MAVLASRSERDDVVSRGQPSSLIFSRPAKPLATLYCSMADARPPPAAPSGAYCFPQHLPALPLPLIKPEIRSPSPPPTIAHRPVEASPSRADRGWPSNAPAPALKADDDGDLFARVKEETSELLAVEEQQEAEGVADGHAVRCHPSTDAFFFA